MSTMDEARRIAREEPQHLDKALAMARASAVDDFQKIRDAERRATVERIRTHLLSELPAPMAPGDEILWSTVVALLDEEAAR